jgi:polysaccharide biosynthesis protein PslH
MPEELKNSFHGVLGNSKWRYANPVLFFRLKKIIQQKKITDLIIVHPYYGWLAWLLKKSTGVKLSMLSHNIEALRFKSMGKLWWKLLWFYEKYTHQILDHNFFVTKEDLDFAVKNYKLDSNKCFVITYGIEWQEQPSIIEKKEAAVFLRSNYGIKDDEKILLFNGTLDYSPNIEAIDYIINNINPSLLKNKNYKYKIIICGKGLPEKYNDLKQFADKNIIYAGFVNDINIFFKGADIFLNPVITGGGIKTKLVEALGNGLSAVSSKSGAFGVPLELVDDKLCVVDDFDWEYFTENIFLMETNTLTSNSFFNHFYWGNIAAKAAGIISGNTTLKK